MKTPLRPARLDWSQGAPYSADFGDVYFSTAGGDAETQHVFLDGNRLEARFRALAPDQPFTLVETGFGTGLNWLCTQALWERCGRPGWLHVVSLEKHPLTTPDLVRAQAAWPAYAAYAAALQARYPSLVAGFHRLVFPALRSTLTLVFADLQDALPHLQLRADAWFLDGFAPRRNPDMWQTTLYAAMARLSHPQATFATFTAAGEVRRGLQAAGFQVDKVPGHGRKREMLRGHFSGDVMPRPEKPWLYRPAPATRERHALVIGAGVAGATTARALAGRGWQVTVLEKQRVASAASGNPAAIVSLSPAPDEHVLTHFPQQASLHALRELAQPENSGGVWHPCGVLELPARNRRKTAAGMTKAPSLPADLWQAVDAETASRRAGIRVPENAAWQPRSGWLDATAWCRHLLDHPAISLREETAADTLRASDNGWRVTTHHGEDLAFPVVVIANSHDAARFAQSTHLPLRKVRGQVALATPSTLSASLATVICGRSYITPPLADGRHCLGASFVPDDDNTDIRATEHHDIRQQLQEALPELERSLPSCATWQGRSSLRCQSEDYLPLVGPVADPAWMQREYAGLQQGRLRDYPPLQTWPGLYVNLAHGSHGFSQALLAAEILASELNAEPAPCSRTALEALHPMRFLIRRLKRGQI